MAVRYEDHHGGMVSVVHCPRYFGKRLVHLSQAGQHSWVFRDYQTGQLLRRSPAPNASFSNHTLAQIEAEVIYSEAPPYHSVEHVQDWVTYLNLRSMAVLGADPTPQPPDPTLGNWRPM